MARVSVQGSDVEGKMERNVGSGEERQLSCMRGDFRLLRAKAVLAFLLCKAAERKAAVWRQTEMLNVGRRKERQQSS